MADLPNDPQDYNDYIERTRQVEYPMIRDAVYLDHAGTTLYSKSLMERFHQDMLANMFGNPHSASPSSQRSTQEVENVRLDLLQFFRADPENFDLVFTANATAAIKTVVEAFREQQDGFSYGYHVDSHTSLIGIREFARDHRCLSSTEEVEHWIDEASGNEQAARPRLYAYPAQSNMNGRRLPLQWCARVRQSRGFPPTYSLLDAAAYASTSALDLSNADAAPDFIVLSLYKIFGFPDLGALIVRRSAAPLFQNRRYFGGGTVDMVVCLKEQWHAKKSGSLHEQLEDGTLPIHSIVALKSAMQTHKELFGTMEKVSKHTACLVKQLYNGLSSLKHANGSEVCTIYQGQDSDYLDVAVQGPIVAFNLRDGTGNWVSNAEVEKYASVSNIHLRTGGVCNPGGVAQALNLAAWELRENFSAGLRCGGENDIVGDKPTGIIRVSFGAMSTQSDALRFLSFINEFFVDRLIAPSEPTLPLCLEGSQGQQRHVESLTVYPIKSCAGWQVPYATPWEIRAEGLAWDREWCIVHQGNGKALSQKQYPRMALIRPVLDFRHGVLRIHGPSKSEHGPNVSNYVSVPLSKDPTYFDDTTFSSREASICGDMIEARMYTSPVIAEFLTSALGVPCTLARFPAASAQSHSLRHSKARLRRPGNDSGIPRPILLSNESPILTISRSSLNRLNEQIKAKGGKAAHPSVFRANIVLAESPLLPSGQEQPWAEDHWHNMRICGEQGVVLDVLGGCRRCQMVCIDQVSAVKNQEPFVTLAKTRRFNGRVLFGVHTALSSVTGAPSPMIKVGDFVETFSDSACISS